MIHFRPDRVAAIMTSKFGAAASERLLQNWPRSLVAPARSTVWRWVKGQTKPPADQIALLAAALDIDPVAMFDSTPEDYARLCVFLLQEVASPERSSLSRELEWAYEFIAPCGQWPPKTLASKFYNRAWAIFDFVHDSKTRLNFFQRLVLSAKLRPFGEPQVWHFAFKSPGALQSVWRPYGIAMRDPKNLRLYHCRGSLLETNLRPDQESFPVETWFGTGPAHFRIASLHPFRTAVLDHWDESTPCLRFP